jgi:hypothetical protein
VGRPTTFAEIASDAKAVSALSTASKPVYGLSFAGDCQGCLGFVMLPDIWASGQHLINGPLGNQTANIVKNAPLKSLLSVYAGIWAAKEAPAADQTQDGTTWGQDFGKATSACCRATTGSSHTFEKEGLSTADFADVPLPSETAATGAPSTVVTTSLSPREPRTPPAPGKLCNGSSPRRSRSSTRPTASPRCAATSSTSAFAAKYPYDAVALNTLKYGSVEYTLAYNAIFNNPGSPWLKMFDEAVYSDNVNQALQIGQSGIQQTLEPGRLLGPLVPTTPPARPHRLGGGVSPVHGLIGEVAV